MTSVIRGVLGTLLAAALIYWVLRGIDPKDLRSSLAAASWWLLALAAIVNFSHNAFRVLRWRWLLEPTRHAVPFRPMFAAVILGYMTTLAGGRIGELVRPALLSAREKLPLGPTMGTIVTDRLLDGFSIVALFAIGSALASFAPSALPMAAKIRAGAWIAFACVVVGLVALALLSTAVARGRRWLAGRSALVRWIGGAILGFAEGAAALRSLRRLVPIVFASVAAWFTIAVGTWLGIRSVGAAVSLSDVFVLMPLLAAGIAIPTPGAAGGYHATMKFGLTTLFGVDPTLAAGAGVLMHLAIAIPIFVAGMILLKTEKISWSDMVAAAKQVRTLGHLETAEAAP
ncbi:MAG TPA: lysylphosphatidylglycerol synthase transmembrane domain-containing protein [Candidatus Polarisedimenticolaceae bacterium]|nr:lysylphosphatidylglycerol synthase transmembrane domain-containing protein [Candidatus Polarisedimenticolaceae bacterium]